MPQPRYLDCNKQRGQRRGHSRGPPGNCRKPRKLEGGLGWIPHRSQPRPQPELGLRAEWERRALWTATAGPGHAHGRPCRSAEVPGPRLPRRGPLTEGSRQGCCLEKTENRRHTSELAAGPLPAGEASPRARPECPPLARATWCPRLLGRLQRARRTLGFKRHQRLSGQASGAAALGAPRDRWRPPHVRTPRLLPAGTVPPPRLTTPDSLRRRGWRGDRLRLPPRRGPLQERTVGHEQLPRRGP